MQLTEYTFLRAAFNAGRSIAARIAMIAITTKSSINVKYFPDRLICLFSLMVVRIAVLVFMVILLIMNGSRFPAPIFCIPERSLSSVAAAMKPVPQA